MPDAVRWLDVDDEIVVFNPISWMFANLDATAAELWRVLGAADWAEIEMIDYLRGRYKMAEPEATSIVRKFVADLEHNHALSRREWNGDRGPPPAAPRARSNSRTDGLESPATE